MAADGLPPGTRGVPPWLPLLVVAALALGSGAAGLRNGFAYDDLHLVVRNPAVHDLPTLPSRFLETYWPAVPLGQAGRLYRPLTVVAFALQWAIGHGSPFSFHLASMLLYVLVSLLVYAVARRLLPIGPATLAAALFAVHPVHTEAVGNVVGQGELLAAAWLLAGTVLYLDSRRVGLGTGRLAGIALCYGLACLAKEHAVLWPILLVPLSLGLPSGRTPAESRENALRLGLILGVELVVYLSLRQAVVGGFAGDLPHPIWRGTTIAVRAVTMLAALPVWTRLLLWPAHLQADYAPQELTLATSLGPAQLGGLMLLGLLALLLLVTWRRIPVAAAGIGWTVLALAPVTNLLTPTGIVLAERTLFLPSVGVVLLIGALVARFGVTLKGEHWARPALGAGCILVLALGLWRSAARLPVWRDNTTLFGATVADAPLSYWAWRNWAGDLVLHDRPVEARAAYARSLALFDRDPTVYDDLASFERREGQCDRAVPLFRSALAIDSTRFMTLSRLIGCLTTLGEYDAARAEARAAIAGGQEEFRSLLQLIDSVSTKAR